MPMSEFTPTANELRAFHMATKNKHKLHMNYILSFLIVFFTTLCSAQREHHADIALSFAENSKTISGNVVKNFKLLKSEKSLSRLNLRIDSLSKVNRPDKADDEMPPWKRQLENAKIAAAKKEAEEKANRANPPVHSGSPSSLYFVCSSLLLFSVWFSIGAFKV